MTEPTHAVFLSYASQDAEAAQKICDALRAAGIEVFLDQSELRGGDVWDQKIRQRIHDCALFIPVISANTASRREGYFRLEWDLADQRSHMMARDSAFIVPVSLDASPGTGTDVPESFHRVQWTRLPAGETSPAFVERVRRLLSPERSTASRPPVGEASGAAPAMREPVRARSWSKPALLAAVVVIVVATGYVALDRFVSKRPAEASGRAAPAVQTAAPGRAAFNPPPHSIAVLPLVNISSDKEQEYFSDGLTEELLNSLAEINELQVAARTSSFSFKGEKVDVETIAHKLNVGAILEGSVRRSGNTVRVTTQLINAVTGFHLWSHTYDRDLGDVLKLETEIADAVASALKVTLLGNVAAKIELGGTHNPDAFDAYLRGWKSLTPQTVESYQTAIAAFGEAIRLDPNYALAFARRSEAFSEYAGAFATGAALREGLNKARDDAQKAIALTPDLAEGHSALGRFYLGSLEFARANDEFERALTLAPGDARTARVFSRLAVDIGHAEAAVAAARRAVVLDPLDVPSHRTLGLTLFYAHRYDEAITAFQDVLALSPDDRHTYGYRGLAYYAVDDLQSARASCETKTDYWGQLCLAIVYDKLGRHVDAEAQLAKASASLGDAASYQYAWVYAQWGNRSKALEWLETAQRLRDPGLNDIKVDPFLDPLRKEPRFQAIERALKFP